MRSEGVVENGDGYADVRAQFARFAGVFGEALEAAEGVGGEDAAQIADDVAVVVVARWPDEYGMQVLHGFNPPFREKTAVHEARARPTGARFSCGFLPCMRRECFIVAQIGRKGVAGNCVGQSHLNRIGMDERLRVRIGNLESRNVSVLRPHFAMRDASGSNTRLFQNAGA